MLAYYLYVHVRCVHRRLETFDSQRKGIIIPLNVIPKSKYKSSNVFQPLLILKEKSPQVNNTEMSLKYFP